MRAITNLVCQNYLHIAFRGGEGIRTERGKFFLPYSEELCCRINFV